jgi:hypothetical protein
MVTVPLHEVAHGRAGDKGNRVNISLIPYRAEAYATLGEQVTEERVLALFRHRGATGVKRHDLPLIAAYNFVIDNVLEGGVNSSLNLDGHGKTQSFRLLALEVTVPEDVLLHPSNAKVAPPAAG